MMLPFSSFAKEIKPGTFELGAGSALSYSTTNEDYGKNGDNKSSSTELVLGSTYYTTKNFGVGIFLNYTSEKNDAAGDSSFWLIGPQLNYHIPIQDNLNAIIGGGIALATMEQEVPGDTINGRGYGAVVGAGLAFFPNDWVSINCTASYATVRVEFDDIDLDADIDTFGFKVGLALYF